MVFYVWILSASFLGQNNIPLYGYTILNVPIHQLMCTCVHSLVIMNNAAMGILVDTLCEHIFLFLLGIYLEWNCWSYGYV